MYRYMYMYAGGSMSLFMDTSKHSKSCETDPGGNSKCAEWKSRESKQPSPVESGHYKESQTGFEDGTKTPEYLH